MYQTVGQVRVLFECESNVNVYILFIDAEEGAPSGASKLTARSGRDRNMGCFQPIIQTH